MRCTPWYPIACVVLALSACSDHDGTRTPLGLLPTDERSLVIPVLAAVPHGVDASIRRTLEIEGEQPDPGGHAPPAPPPGGPDPFAGALTREDSLARMLEIPTSIRTNLETYFRSVNDSVTGWMLELEAYVRANKVVTNPSAVILRRGPNFTFTPVPIPALEPQTWRQNLTNLREMAATARGQELHFIHWWRRLLPVPICGLVSNGTVTATAMWNKVPGTEALPPDWGATTKETSDLESTSACSAPTCPPGSSPRDGLPEQDASATPMGTVMSASGDCGPPTGGGGGGGGGGGRWIQIEICFGNHVYDSNGNYLYSEILYCITDYIYVE